MRELLVLFLIPLIILQYTYLVSRPAFIPYKSGATEMPFPRQQRLWAQLTAFLFLLALTILLADSTGLPAYEIAIFAEVCWLLVTFLMVKFPTWRHGPQFAPSLIILLLLTNLTGFVFTGSH